MAQVKGCGLKKGKGKEKRERERERDEFEIAVAVGSQRERSTLTDLAPFDLAPSKDDFTENYRISVLQCAIYAIIILY